MNTDQQPMPAAQVIPDLYESNANRLIAELRNKLAKLRSVRNGAKPDGDYQLTVSAMIQTVEAALTAAETQAESVRLSYSD